MHALRVVCGAVLPASPSETETFLKRLLPRCAGFCAGRSARIVQTRQYYSHGTCACCAMHDTRARHACAAACLAC